MPKLYIEKVIKLELSLVRIGSATPSSSQPKRRGDCELLNWLKINGQILAISKGIFVIRRARDTRAHFISISEVVRSHHIAIVMLPIKIKKYVFDTSAQAEIYILK